MPSFIRLLINFYENKAIISQWREFIELGFIDDFLCGTTLCVKRGLSVLRNIDHRMSVTRLQNAISAKFNLQVVEDIVNKKSHLEETIVENIRIDENFTNKGDAYIGQICRLGIEICGKNKT